MGFSVIERFYEKTCRCLSFPFQVTSGRVVTVESTPTRLLGGPLADTDIALKKLPIRGGALQKVKMKPLNGLKKTVPI